MKLIARTGASNWPEAWLQKVSAASGIYLWRIPKAEIEANQGISDADNNPVVSF